jgi:hypothetical protein
MIWCVSGGGFALNNFLYKTLALEKNLNNAHFSKLLKVHMGFIA